jgi:hypothetical protein
VFDEDVAEAGREGFDAGGNFAGNEICKEFEKVKK